VLPRRVPRHRGDAREETRLVAVGRVHVAQLVVGRDRAAAGAHRDERAVVALLPRRQALEVAQRLRAVNLGTAVDVADRLPPLAGEAGAGEQTSVWAAHVR